MTRPAPATILTRKDQRKQARQQKKQNKASYYQQRGKKAQATAGHKTVAPRHAPTQQGNRVAPSAKRARPAELSDDEEILSDDLVSGDEDQSEEPEESSHEGAALVSRSRFPKGLNKYGTEDPIMAAAEEALDNGLFDSEGNMDAQGFEGLFGSKFDDDEPHEDGEEQMESSESGSEGDLSDAEGEARDSAAEEEEARTPPVKRAAEEPSEERHALIKKAKGLLNRLSMGNFESIAVSIEAFYKAHPRRLVTEVITDLVLAAITTQPNLLDSFVLVFASLVATLAHLAGVDFVAHLLQSLVELFSRNNELAAGSSSGDDALAVTPERVVMNLVTFLAFLYDLQMVSYQLVGDVIREAVQRLSELDTEVILRLVRHCGAQFRRDDPSTLKAITLALNERLLSVPREGQTSRFRFMLESIYDLKNNKLRAAAVQLGDMETTKRLLRNMAQQRGIAKFEPLRIGLDDIRHAETRGRWWLVGGTWAPDADRHKRGAEPEPAAQPADSIAALARAQCMNTCVRKTVFAALVSCDDYVDGFQRLLGLKLTSKQERDIPTVILHCCAQERAYNPFYALLAQRCIQFRHNHLVTFKYAFWDWLQQIGEAPLRKLSHLAHFYAFLVGQQALPLAMLKKADFLHLSEREALFFQVFFCKVLLEPAEETLSAIFEQLGVRRKRQTETRSKPKRRSVFGEDEEMVTMGEGNEEDEDHQTAEDTSSREDMSALKAALKLFLAFYLKDKPASELPPFVKDTAHLNSRIDRISAYLGSQ